MLSANWREQLAAATLSLIFAVCTGGCVQPNDDTQTTVPPHHAGAGRVFDEKGFSIEPPEGYSNIGRSAFHVMNFVGPSDDGFPANFNVNIQRDDGTDLAQAGRKTAQFMAWLLKDYFRIEDGFALIDGRKAYFCSGTFRWENTRCRNLQYFIRGKNGNIYIITFASDERTFPLHRSIFERAALTARTD